MGWGSGDRGNPPVDNVQMYAMLESGVAKEIIALSPRCPVTTDTPISDLGDAAVTDSVEWLQSNIEPKSHLNRHVVAAISVHRGKRARDLLMDLARSSDLDGRKNAIFWMARVGIDETEREVRRFMFHDDDPDIRRHAAFAFSQSRATDRAEALIRQGKEDPDSGVRSQA